MNAFAGIRTRSESYTSKDRRLQHFYRNQHKANLSCEFALKEAIFVWNSGWLDGHNTTLCFLHVNLLFVDMVFLNSKDTVNCVKLWKPFPKSQCLCLSIRSSLQNGWINLDHDLYGNFRLVDYSKISVNTCC